jgi:3-oxoacyl-[acyl-carrier-protein] synthase II
VANAPAAQVAIHCRAAGRNHTICQREAGPLTALARGAAGVASGRAARALAGAAEEITPLVFATLDRFRALARPVGGAPESARPFDRRRDGFTVADGAAVLVLEPAEAAAARGARVLARVRGWGGAFDPTAGRSGWGTGSSVLARELQSLLDRMGLAPSDFDRIVSGASGAVAGDRLEAAVLDHVFAGAPPPVLAPKGVTGEYGGGFLAAAVLAAAGRPFGAKPGCERPDPALAVVAHHGSPLPPPHRLLITSLAAGGSAAWVILEAP